MVRELTGVLRGRKDEAPVRKQYRLLVGANGETEEVEEEENTHFSEDDDAERGEGTGEVEGEGANEGGGERVGKRVREGGRVGEGNEGLEEGAMAGDRSGPVETGLGMRLSGGGLLGELSSNPAFAHLRDQGTETEAVFGTPDTE